MNANTTQLAVFDSRQNLRSLPNITVTFCRVVFKPQAEARNLGVVLDSALTWESHVSELTRQCTGVLAGLAHCRHYLPDGVIKVLVTALVLSRIRYCLTVYGSGSQQNFNRLKKKCSTSR